MLRVTKDLGVMQDVMELREQKVNKENPGLMALLDLQAPLDQMVQQDHQARQDLLVFREQLAPQETQVKKDREGTQEREENLENRVYQVKEALQVPQERLVQMVPQVWMVEKDRKEHRVMQDQWAHRECQGVQEHREKLVMMVQQALLVHRVTMDDLVPLDFLVRLVKGEILEPLVLLDHVDLKDDREDVASKDRWVQQERRVPQVILVHKEQWDPLEHLELMVNLVRLDIMDRMD